MVHLFASKLQRPQIAKSNSSGIWIFPSGLLYHLRVWVEGVRIIWTKCFNLRCIPSNDHPSKRWPIACVAVFFYSQRWSLASPCELWEWRLHGRKIITRASEISWRIKHCFLLVHLVITHEMLSMLSMKNDGDWNEVLDDYFDSYYIGIWYIVCPSVVISINLLADTPRSCLRDYPQEVRPNHALLSLLEKCKPFFALNIFLCGISLKYLTKYAVIQKNPNMWQSSFQSNRIHMVYVEKSG